GRRPKRCPPTTQAGRPSAGSCPLFRDRGHPLTSREAFLVPIVVLVNDGSPTLRICAARRSGACGWAAFARQSSTHWRGARRLFEEAVSFLLAGPRPAFPIGRTPDPFLGEP